MKAILAALILCLAVVSASAHARHHHMVHHRHYARWHDGRPRAWCGWEMRRELGVADPRYNVQPGLSAALSNDAPLHISGRFDVSDVLTLARTIVPLVHRH